MDQLKDILKQAIKYRFWIAVGISALLPMIAYFVGVGPDPGEGRRPRTAKIKAADDGRQASTPRATVPNDQYKPIVDREDGGPDQGRQRVLEEALRPPGPAADLARAASRSGSTTWGRKWPENVDASAVQIAIIDYINAYPTFVTEVYKTFQPFDSDEGTGVVAAPPEEALLRPVAVHRSRPRPSWARSGPRRSGSGSSGPCSTWSPRSTRTPRTGTRAIIKQINAARGRQPAGPGPAVDRQGRDARRGPRHRRPRPRPPPPPRRRRPAERRRCRRHARRWAAPAWAAAAATAESVYYIKTDSTQFKILPVQMTVLIDQDHIQDFLVALENSPMAIQVMDFEMSKPVSPRDQAREGRRRSAFGGHDGHGMGMGGGMMMAGMSGDDRASAAGWRRCRR